MKRIFVVKLECDSDDTQDFIINDIEQELGCCSTMWSSIAVEAMRRFQTNGASYLVPAKSCVCCEHCTDVCWDFTNGPYMAVCRIDKDTTLGGKGKCESFEEGR